METRQRFPKVWDGKEFSKITEGAYNNDKVTIVKNECSRFWFFGDDVAYIVATWQL
jgi:hypothetical protein